MLVSTAAMGPYAPCRAALLQDPLCVRHDKRSLGMAYSLAHPDAERNTLLYAHTVTNG